MSNGIYEVRLKKYPTDRECTDIAADVIRQAHEFFPDARGMSDLIAAEITKRVNALIEFEVNEIPFSKPADKHTHIFPGDSVSPSSLGNDYIKKSDLVFMGSYRFENVYALPKTPDHSRCHVSDSHGGVVHKGSCRRGWRSVGFMLDDCDVWWRE